MARMKFNAKDPYYAALLKSDGKEGLTDPIFADVSHSEVFGRQADSKAVGQAETKIVAQLSTRCHILTLRFEELHMGITCNPWESLRFAY